MASANLQDKVAIVTSASEGLGQALALGLAQDGATIVAVDQTHSDETVALISETGCTALSLVGDVTHPETSQMIRSLAADTFGRADILVNSICEMPVTSLVEPAHGDWCRAVSAKMDASSILANALSDMMKTGGFGRVINVISPLTIAAKFDVSVQQALLRSTSDLAADLAQHRTTANTIVQPVPHGIERQPFEEMQGALSFLASEDAAFITGQILCVDRPR